MHYHQFLVQKFKNDPASTTHAQVPAEELARAGISQGSVRLSIGCEHAGDIIADLAQAFEALR